nr:reverse transcriptase domain-containing protein [Tanacetum cinerariifolium]
MTATLKYRGVPNDAIKLMLFPYSLEGDARIWFEKEHPNSILTWNDLVNKFINQFFPPSKTTHLKNKISRFTQRFEGTFREAWDRFKEMLRACPHHRFLELTQIDMLYNGLTEQDQDSLNAALGGNLLNKTTREAWKIIENKSKVRYSRSKSNVSRMNMNSRDNVSKTDYRIDKLADQISNLVEIVNKQVITPASAKVVEKTCVTCGGDHAYYDCIATNNNRPSVCAATDSYNQVSLPNRASHQIPPPGFALCKTIQTGITKAKMKAVTTRSGLAYEGPPISTNFPLHKVVEQNIEEIIDEEHYNFPGCTAQVQPPVVPISIPEPDIPRTQPKPTIPYPSRLNDQKLRENATNQMEKFFQIFHDLHFDISFVDALLLMSKFASTIKSLLINKDKVFELAKVSLNENLSAMLLKKLPEKLGYPGKFLISCDFPGMEMTHELADRSITRPKGVSKDVFVKVGKFHFPTDFVVVDFEADPRVPLILGRSFLRTGRALINVYGEEITLKVNDESVTFNVNQTMRYSLTYDDKSVNRVDVIDIACEEFVQNVLDFQYNSKSSNPTLVFYSLIPENDFCKEPIVKSSSPTLTPFRESDFFLKEIKDFLNDDSIPTGIENSVFDPEGDILFLKKLLNEDTFQLPSMDLKLAKETNTKSSVEEPPDLELKELPSYLEYAFLEDSNKLQVIISKDIKPVGEPNLLCAQDGYLQIPINPQDQEKTTFTGPYGTFAYRRMPFGLCNAPGHKISKSGIEVDRAKVDVIAKHHHPTTVKGSENLAADHLSRLDNPHKDVLENKDINENFPLETLGSLTSFDILKACHEGPTGGHHGANLTVNKGIDFMGLFPSSKGNKYILVAVDYHSKWVEVKALPTNDARVVLHSLHSTVPYHFPTSHSHFQRSSPPIPACKLDESHWTKWVTTDYHQAHLIEEKYTILLVKEAQGVYMDCHPGNPCDISSINPTAQIDSARRS